MVRFSKAVMQSTAKILRKNLKEGKGYLNSIKMKDMDGKTRTLSKPQYMGLFEAQNIFIMKQGRYPNYTTLNSTANNPLVLNYQDDSVSCCVASFNMCVKMLFYWISEDKIKKTFKTDKNGTSPSNFIKGADQLGYKVTRIQRNFASVKKSINQGFPVEVHYETAGDTKPKCAGFINNYGHYGMIYGIDNKGYYLFADPTKGLRKCAPSELDKATNGRDIGYYSIKPK